MALTQKDCYRYKQRKRERQHLAVPKFSQILSDTGLDHGRWVEEKSSDDPDKLTVSSAHGQLIGGC